MVSVMAFVFVEGGEFGIGFIDPVVSAGNVLGICREGSNGNFASVDMKLEFAGCDEGGELRNESDKGGTNENGGNAAEGGFGGRVIGRTETTKVLERMKVGKRAPCIVSNEMRSQLGVEVEEDIIVDAKVSGEAVGGMVRIA